MEVSNGQLDLMGPCEERSLRTLPINLGVPNPWLVIEAMANVRSLRENHLVGREKDLGENSEEHQHLGWAEEEGPAKAAER